MRYGFHPEALAEYEAATAYYVARDPAVAERSAIVPVLVHGLGTRFE
jgi:hypothetical protein